MIKITEKARLLKICVITQPFVETTKSVLLFNFLEILEPLSDEIFIITGNAPEKADTSKKIHVLNIKSKNNKRNSELSKYLNFVIDFTLTQLKFSHTLIKISKNIDVVIFFMGSLFLLPMLFAKLLRKKTILIAVASYSKSAEKIFSKRLFGYGGIILGGLYRILERINYVLSDRIVVFSEGHIDQLELNKYKSKISSNGAHFFVDPNLFKMTKNFSDKRNLIGYVGRLSAEKGVINFVKAIPMIVRECKDVEFLIGGDGSLFDEIEKELKKNQLNEKVTITGWIPHEELAKYLNELKLLVIPSYTETGPVIALEAIVCGTPVLATEVGLIPYLIKDEQTGFTLENNSPECIIKNVIRVLKYPNLDEIVKNARELIEEEYTYKAAVERYKRILEGI